MSLGSHCLKYKHSKKAGPWWVPKEALLDPLAQDQQSQGEGTGQREAGWDATGRKLPRDLFCSWAQDTHSA